MSEWLKEHAWKACVGETLPRVRIPLSPPPPRTGEVPCLDQAGTSPLARQSLNAPGRAWQPHVSRSALPCVAWDSETTEGGFADAYPRLATFITRYYRRALTFPNYDGGQSVIAVRQDLQAQRTYGPDAWPCGFGTVLPIGETGP